MTKIKPTNLLTLEEFYNGLIYNSPYSTVAIKYLKLKGLTPDFNGCYKISDLLEAYHELAKVDHRINKTGE